MDPEENKLSKKIQRNNYYISLGLNLFLITALTIIIVLGRLLTDTRDTYVRFGPQPTLIVFSFVIDTGAKYAGLVISLVLYAMIDVFISNTTNNELWNNIFSSAVIRVYNYKNEQSLMFCAQVIYLCNALRSALAVKLMVTQIDLVLIILVSSWLMNFFPIYLSMENKCFGPHDGLPNNGRGCERYYRRKDEDKNARQMEFSQFIEAARKTQPTSHVFVPPRV